MLDKDSRPWLISCELRVEHAAVCARGGCDSSFRHIYGARFIIKAAKDSQMRYSLCNERIENRVLDPSRPRIRPAHVCHPLILKQIPDVSAFLHTNLALDPSWNIVKK